MTEIICVMLETKDGRKFFFKKTALVSLKAFIKNFPANIFIVETDAENVKSIKENVKLICDQSYKPEDVEYKTINSPQILSKRVKSVKVREIIKKNFIKNKKITFKEIQYIFRKVNISASSLNQYFAQIRNELESENFKINKIKNGCYVILN